MTERTITVTAPSRLHFGMFAFGQPGEREFGGIGAMIDRPGLQLRVSPAATYNIVGPLADRVRGFAAQVLDQLDIHTEPRCQIAVLSSPPEHVGLGVGTQLGLSVATALNAFFGRRPLSAVELARLAGRGARSAIGSHGFAQGGLLVDAGKLPGEALSPLLDRAELPAAWRFVLLLPSHEQGIHGDEERQAFRELPPVSLEMSQNLREIALQRLLPAARAARFADFSGDLYRYGYAAGLCFAKFQAGPYANPRLLKLVECIRALGVEGVGQSSWGTSLFALVQNDAAARQLIELLRTIPETEGTDFVIAAPNNTGARVEMEQTMSRNLKALAEQLSSTDGAVRADAVEKIGLMDEGAAPLAVPLVRALADSDETVRELVNSALESLGPPSQEAVDELEPMLTDANADVAFWAATLLGRLEGGAVQAVEALKTASAEHPSHEVRKRATWALGKIASG